MITLGTLRPVAIDHEAPGWPYQQLAAILRERIGSGEYPAGRRIPAIIELTAEFGLSAKTVRRGIKVLEDEGLVVTVASRGTFVTNH
jgi:DNA-binding GntR family transcriptional regulator